MTEAWRCCASCGAALPASAVLFCTACGSPADGPAAQRHRSGGGRVVAVVVTALVAVAAVAGGVALLGGDGLGRDGIGGESSAAAGPRSTSPAAAATPAAPKTASRSSSSTATDLAQRFGPGVFRIEVEGCGQEGSGTGFAVDAHHVVTNHHVVGIDPTPVLVGRDGSRRQGRVTGWRQSPDIAVVEVGDALPVWLPWADTGSLTEGQSLVALGYPVPDLAFSVTQADIVSFQTRAGVRRAVRTDGALDRGNSGGPALTAEGEVAGVVTEMEANSSGLQLVALLYTADALATDVQAILDRPIAVDATCDAGPEVLPEEWEEDYADAPAPAQAYGFGDDPRMDGLQDACAAGDMSACDQLYETSPYDSAYEAFGATCGQRTDWMAGLCTGWQTDPQLEPEWRVGSDRHVYPDPRVEPEPQVEPDPQLEPDPPVEPDYQLEPDPQVEPDPQLEPDLQLEPDPQLEPDLQLEPEPQGEPEPHPELPPEPPVA